MPRKSTDVKTDLPKMFPRKDYEISGDPARGIPTHYHIGGETHTVTTLAALGFGLDDIRALVDTLPVMGRFEYGAVEFTVPLVILDMR